MNRIDVEQKFCYVIVLQRFCSVHLSNKKKLLRKVLLCKLVLPNFEKDDPYIETIPCLPEQIALNVWQNLEYEYSCVIIGGVLNYNN